MIAISITCHGRMRENNLEIVLSDRGFIRVETLLGPGVGTRQFYAIYSPDIDVPIPYKNRFTNAKTYSINRK